MADDTQGPTSPDQPSKPQGRRPMSKEHRYNNPNIGPIEFLQEVMRASHLPMMFRTDAAKFLSKLELPHPMDRPPEYTIHIEGELIANPTGNEYTTMDDRRYRSRILGQDPKITKQ